jgi:prepilin-type N-terminal cleavage/methylation domain-containing protein
MFTITRPAIPRLNRAPADRGFTLLELLIATVITLILTALVAQMFQFVTDGVFHSRANIELNDQLRNAKHRLIQDLRGVTAPTVPPLDPSAEMGYFEYVEGAGVANTLGGDVGGLITTSQRDTIMGDRDDLLMFTAYSLDDPFVGKAGSGKAIKSRYAEIAWFTRAATSNTHIGGYNLHRRTWLISDVSMGGNYTVADQSMRQEYGSYETEAAPTLTTVGPRAVRNTLGDLTMRERRSVHQPYVQPFNMFYSTNASSSGIIETWSGVPVLSLPTMSEQSHSNFPNPVYEVWEGTFSKTWRQKPYGTTHANFPRKGAFLTPGLGAGSRESEDIILTNVISFDIKAWDPGAPIFKAILTTQTSTTGVGMALDPNAVGLIVPGDPGYGWNFGAVQKFMDTPVTGTFMPVGFGAFADLNYLHLDRQTLTVNNARRVKYLTKLAEFESKKFRGDAADAGAQLPRPSFGFGNSLLSGVDTTTTGTPSFQPPAVYDTWSRHYEYDGHDTDGDGTVDEGTNGLDDDGDGYVDETIAVDSNGDGVIKDAERDERDAPPPFDAPLRGIKITIRVMEQDSRQIREVSTVHEFIPF